MTVFSAGSRTILVFLLFLLIPRAVAAEPAADSYLASLPTARVAINDERFAVWVAGSPEARSRGLKGVPASLLAPEEDGPWLGMLFVFADDSIPGFWMKDTPTALDIAFIDQDWLIESIRTMTPRSEKTHSPDSPIRYAIEVPAGLFDELGIVPGMRVRLLFPGLPSS